MKSIVMNPIQKYIQHLFAKKRVLADDPKLTGLAQADKILLDLVNEKKVPGLSITVLKEGKVFLQKGYGFANIEDRIPVNAKKTIFRIASVSKPIAATALMHMVNEGKIDLDTSFYDYVPYYPKKEYDFTIKQLAGHTAGIRGYRGIEYVLNKPYTIRESIEIFKDDDLLFEPGKGYEYNSYDWVLISLAMQEASGIPFKDYVRKKVLEPLGMVHTYTPERVTSAALSDLALVAERSRSDIITTFYSKNRRGFRVAKPVNNFYKLAGGGYLSTSEDIAKLGQAYLEGRILNDEIRSEFLSSQTVNGKPTYYGLGWQVSQDGAGRPFYGHVGNGVGGYSNFFVYPQEEMVFAILINCTIPDVQGELDAVVDALLKPSRTFRQA